MQLNELLQLDDHMILNDQNHHRMIAACKFTANFFFNEPN